MTSVSNSPFTSCIPYEGVSEYNIEVCGFLILCTAGGLSAIFFEASLITYLILTAMAGLIGYFLLCESPALETLPDEVSQSEVTVKQLFSNYCKELSSEIEPELSDAYAAALLKMERFPVGALLLKRWGPRSIEDIRNHNRGKIKYLLKQGTDEESHTIFKHFVISTLREQMRDLVSWYEKWGVYLKVEMVQDTPACLAVALRIAKNDQTHFELDDERELGPYEVVAEDLSLMRFQELLWPCLIAGKKIEELEAVSQEEIEVLLRAEATKGRDLFHHSEPEELFQRMSTAFQGSYFYQLMLYLDGFEPSKFLFTTATENSMDSYMSHWEEGPSLSSFQATWRRETVQKFLLQLDTHREVLKESHGVVLVYLRSILSVHTIYMRLDEERRILRLFDNNFGMLRFPLDEGGSFKEGVERLMECFLEIAAIAYTDLLALTVEQCKKR